MAVGLKEDLKVIKQFKDDYKKCNVVSEKEAKEAETFAKRIKYFRYDLANDYEVLEDEVLEMKADPEPIAASKIKDYAVKKEVRVILKDVDWNLGKLIDAHTKLEKLEKEADIDASRKKLNNLSAKIALDTKMRKGGKPEPMVAKLQKQIEADRKVLDKYYVAIKKFLPDHPKLPDPKKEYERKIKLIMAAKPRIKAKTKKFNDLFSGILKDAKIKTNTKTCKTAQTKMNKFIEEALNKVNAGDSKGGIPSWQKSQKQLNTIKVKVKKYSGIQKTYAAEIKKLDDKKRKSLKKSLEKLVKIEQDAIKQSEDAMKEIDEQTKENSKNQGV